MKHHLRRCELEIGYKSRSAKGQQKRSVVYLGCAAPPVTLAELELMLEYLNGFEDDTAPLFPDEPGVSVKLPPPQNDNDSAPAPSHRETK